MKLDPPVFHRYRLARIFKVHVRVIDRWIATGKLRATTDDLGRACCTYGQVRHFIMLYGRETAVERVDQLRKHIFMTYAAYPHAFELGCGRDMMVHWICEATEVRHSPRAIRRALDEIAAEGLFLKGVSYSGHTTYHLNEQEQPMSGDPYDEKNIRSRDFTCHATIKPKHDDSGKFTLTLAVSDGPEVYTHHGQEPLDADGESSLTEAIAQGCNLMIQAAQQNEAFHWIDDHQQVYIVVGRTGQGPDAQSWNVHAFASEEKANGVCYRMNDWCEGMGLQPGGRRVATMLDPQGDVVKHPEDPNFRIDGGTEYEVIKVHLDMFDPHDD